MVQMRGKPRITLIIVFIAAWLFSWPSCSFAWQCRTSKTKVCARGTAAGQEKQSLPELPIAVDSFERLRTRKPAYAYVDKTACLPGLIGDGRQHFLARPRRFGKTLLLDTIKCVFMENGAKKELFKGLDITKTDDGLALLQQELPVVFLKLNDVCATEGKRTLMDGINEQLIEEAGQNGALGVQPTEKDVGTTLSRVIRAIRLKHNNKRVVFLVDEYDAPITQVLEANGGETDRSVRENLKVLRGLYTSCKVRASNDFHYSMYTGVSRFAATSFFSGSNQLDDVTFTPNMASIVGFTAQEIEENFPGHLELSRNTYNTSLDGLAMTSGGYRFSSPPQDGALLNPWVVLNKFKDEARGAENTDEWNAQTPSWARKLLSADLIPDILQKMPEWKPLGVFKHIEVDSLQSLSGDDRIALLLQTGYLTIAASKRIDGEPHVRLNIPNSGVKNTFWKPALLGKNASEYSISLLDALAEGLFEEKLENATAAVEKLLKLAPWATLLDKVDIVQWFSQLLQGWGGLR